MKLKWFLLLHVPMSWAQGVVSSNLAAPTNVNNSFCCNVGLWADKRTCSELWRFEVLGGFEQLRL